MATASPTGTRKDPLPTFCFKVELSGIPGWSEPASAFFKSVSGINFETEVVPVVEGGANDTTFQLPGTVKWSNIVLKQGFTASSSLIQWRQQWVSGQGQRIPTGQIILLDTSLTAQATWTFVRGWPAKWNIGDFDASKSELAIETLEIAHEGIKFG
jgi:phage tail-like protein